LLGRHPEDLGRHGADEADLLQAARDRPVAPEPTPAIGGVTFGFDPIPALGFAASSIFVPDAELRTLTLMQLEFKIEGRSETIPASGTFGGLLFNGEVFEGLITLSTPLGDDEAKEKRFYALPEGDAFSAPFTLAGTLSGDPAVKEIELKIKFGTGTFAARAAAAASRGCRRAGRARGAGKRPVGACRRRTPALLYRLAIAP
jgi:hypothetical protein